MNLWKKLEASFTVNASRPSITDQNGCPMTYGDLRTAAREIAAFIRLNVADRARICVLHSQSYHDAMGILGVLAANCIGIPMSLHYGESNCCKIMQRAEPDALLTDVDPLPDTLQKIIHESHIKVLPLTRSAEPPFCEPEAAEEDVALLMFTSGTTGFPKGAMLSHRNVMSNLDGIAAYFTLTREDHFLICRPLYHGAVMTGEFFHALLHGVQISFYSESFSPKRLLAYLAERKCSVLCGTPTLFYHLALAKRKNELPYLRKITMSGECLNPQVADKLTEVFPEALFWNVYGLTEASPRVCHLDPVFFHQRIGSVGVPLFNVNVKVTDDSGDETARNTIGELWVRGPSVMKGYWRDEALTDSKITDGWLHTGDLARMDEEGFVYIISRKDDMIIRAGVNIYPQEIENNLLKTASVKEIMVWGETDKTVGQRICAAVVPQDGADMTVKSFMAICRDYLEPYQWPDEMIPVEALPRNATGKVVRGRPAQK